MVEYIIGVLSKYIHVCLMIQYHTKVSLLISFPVPQGAVEVILSSVTHGATVDVDVAPSHPDSKTSVVNITVRAATIKKLLAIINPLNPSSSISDDSFRVGKSTRGFDFSTSSCLCAAGIRPCSGSWSSCSYPSCPWRYDRRGSLTTGKR